MTDPDDDNSHSDHFYKGLIAEQVAVEMWDRLAGGVPPDLVDQVKNVDEYFDINNDYAPNKERIDKEIEKSSDDDLWNKGNSHLRKAEQAVNLADERGPTTVDYDRLQDIVGEVIGNSDLGSDGFDSSDYQEVIDSVHDGVTNIEAAVQNNQSMIRENNDKLDSMEEDLTEIKEIIEDDEESGYLTTRKFLGLLGALYVGDWLYDEFVADPGKGGTSGRAPSGSIPENRRLEFDQVCPYLSPSHKRTLQDGLREDGISPANDSLSYELRPDPDSEAEGRYNLWVYRQGEGVEYSLSNIELDREGEKC